MEGKYRYEKCNEEEMNHLRASSYVLDVSPSIVHFSAEFKKKFWEAILAGKKPRDIVIDLGIDPDILGETRVNGLKGMIRNEVKAGNGFGDLNTYNKYLGGYITYIINGKAHVVSMTSEILIHCVPSLLGISNIP